MRIESGSISFDPTQDDSTRDHHVLKSRKTPTSKHWIVESVMENQGPKGAIAAKSAAIGFNLSRGIRQDTAVGSAGHVEPDEEYYRRPEPGEEPTDIIEEEPVIKEVHQQTDNLSHISLRLVK